MTTLISRILTLALFISLSGCVLFRSHSKPTLQGVQLEHAQLVELLSELKIRGERVQSLRALARVGLQAGDERSSFRQAFVFQKPSSFRMESLPIIGAHTLSLLLFDGQELTLIDPMQHEAIVTPPSAPAMARLVGVPVDVLDFIYLLSGTVPLSVSRELGRLKVYFDADASMYQIVVGDFDKYFEVDSKTFLLRQVEIRDQFSNALRARIEYEQYSSEQLPEHITLYIPRVNVRTSLRFSVYSINKSIPISLFDVDIPDGYRVQYLDAS